MKKYKIYPKGYRPMVADFPMPSLDLKQLGITWTIKEHEHQKKLEGQVQIEELDNPPTDRWYELKE